MGARILLDEANPYHSRRLTVEQDADATAAYLSTPRGDVLVPLWLANHRAGGTDTSPRGAVGAAPVLAAEATKHPSGLKPFDPAELRAVWFEEGDGVALLDEKGLLALIPGWADADRGVPGYAREAARRTTYAWPLDEVASRLWPRVVHAEAYWQWRESPGAWKKVQRTVFGHLTERLGAGGHFWDVSDGTPPLICVSERPAGAARDFHVISTVGMSGQRMPTLDRYMADVGEYARVELALATTLPPERVARVFRWLGVFPWRAVTWFGPGHSIKWFQGEDGSGLGRDYAAALLVARPNALEGPAAPDLSGLVFHGDPVQWLWVVPITRAEHLFAKEHDSTTLLEKLAAEGRSWVL